MPLIEGPLWGDTRVQLPFDASGQKLNGLFSTVAVTPHRELMLSAALQDFALNLLIQP